MGYFLNTGSLASTEGCSIGDYRIDWHLDSISGDIVFVSGNDGNTDEDIEAVHPLVDEIVVGGTLYPVIRYVYVSGLKYSPYIEEGALYSPDLLECLPPKIVDSIECGAILDPNSVYDWRYTRDVNVGEKSRSFRFNLDGISNYIGWAFTALQIVDRLNIYYCTSSDSEGEIIDSFVIGTGITTDYTPTNYPRQPGYDPNVPVDPIRISTNLQVRYVSDVSSFSFSPGDWLRFEIEGNYLTPSQTDTKWTLEIKCLPAIDTSNNFDDVGKFNEPTYITASVNGGCSYTFKYETMDHFNSTNNNTNIFLRKYFYFNIAARTFAGSSGTLSINSGGGVTHTLNYIITVPETRITNQVLNTFCSNLNGVITVNKTGTNFSLSFTNSSDYQRVVDNLTFIQISARYTAYLAANNTQAAYYGHYKFMIRRAIGGCDVSHTQLDYYIHFSSVITYDSILKTINFTLPSLINNYPDSGFSCDTSYDVIDAVVNNINSTASGSNIVYSTDVRFSNSTNTGDGLPEAYGYSDAINIGPTQHGVRYLLYINNIMTNGLFNPYSFGMCDTDVSGIDYVGIHQVYDMIEVSDVTDVLNNYTFSRRRHLETLVCTDTMFDVVKP